MSLPLPLDKHPNTTHGMTNSRVYKIWSGMHSRCKLPSATGFKNYGGKGVGVCVRWDSFEAFLEDMGNPPDGFSIERKDGSVGYEPRNCIWATKTDQNRNQHDLMYLTHDGRTQCLSAWADEFGFPRSTYDAVRGRINHGWDHSKALTTPVRGHKKYERRSV